MGMIDVAYIPPYGVRNDYSDNWGTDDLEFFSRYDGLLYIRLNQLGAYCLGLIDDYQPLVPRAKESVKVLPNLDIVAMPGKLPPGDILFLDTYALKVSDTVWRLDHANLLGVIEKGGNLNKFTEWLDSRSAGALPETVNRFIADVGERTTALQVLGVAKMIECSNPTLATLIANDTKTGKLCYMVGKRGLVVPVEFETRFRTAVRKLGYSLPK
jgi:hypothetical protein